MHTADAPLGLSPVTLRAAAATRLSNVLLKTDDAARLSDQGHLRALMSCCGGPWRVACIDSASLCHTHGPSRGALQHGVWWSPSQERAHSPARAVAAPHLAGVSRSNLCSHSSGRHRVLRWGSPVPSLHLLHHHCGASEGLQPAKGCREPIPAVSFVGDATLQSQAPYQLCQCLSVQRRPKGHQPHPFHEK